jgi:hypothetical protein
MARRTKARRVKKVLLSDARDDSFDLRLQHDPRFLRRIEQARASLRAGHGIKLEDVEPK